MEPGQVTIQDPDERIHLPWHLKLLAGAAAIYLGYRAFQGIEWLIQSF